MRPIRQILSPLPGLGLFGPPTPTAEAVGYCLSRRLTRETRW